MREVLLPIELLRFSAKKRRGVSQKRVEELRMQIEMEEDIMPILRGVRRPAPNSGTFGSRNFGNFGKGQGYN